MLQKLPNLKNAIALCVCHVFGKAFVFVFLYTGSSNTAIFQFCIFFSCFFIIKDFIIDNTYH